MNVVYDGATVCLRGVADPRLLSQSESLRLQEAEDALLSFISFFVVMLEAHALVQFRQGNSALAFSTFSIVRAIRIGR